MELNKKFYAAKEAVHNALCGTQFFSIEEYDL